MDHSELFLHHLKELDWAHQTLYNKQPEIFSNNSALQENADQYPWKSALFTSYCNSLYLLNQQNMPKLVNASSSVEIAAPTMFTDRAMYPWHLYRQVIAPEL